MGIFFNKYLRIRNISLQNNWVSPAVPEIIQKDKEKEEYDAKLDKKERFFDF